MRTIIAGGREFCNPIDKPHVILNEEINYFLECMNNHKSITQIVCGMAKGADEMGLQFGEKLGTPVAKFHANWDKFGKKAGLIRNKEMADNADALIAFWNGQSRGTKNMIDNALKNKLEVHVYFTDKLYTEETW